MGVRYAIVAPASVQYDSVRPAVLPAVIAGAVRSTVEGEHTAAGLLITRVHCPESLTVNETKNSNGKNVYFIIPEKFLLFLLKPRPVYNSFNASHPVYHLLRFIRSLVHLFLKQKSYNNVRVRYKNAHASPFILINNCMKFLFISGDGLRHFHLTIY